MVSTSQKSYNWKIRHLITELNKKKKKRRILSLNYSKGENIIFNYDTKPSYQDQQ